MVIRNLSYAVESFATKIFFLDTILWIIADVNSPRSRDLDFISMLKWLKHP